MRLRWAGHVARMAKQEIISECLRAGFLDDVKIYLRETVS